MRNPGRIRLRRDPRLTAVALAASLLLVSVPGRAASWKEPTDDEKQIVEDAAKGFIGAVYLEKTYQTTTGAFGVYVRAKILSKAGFDVGTVDQLDADSYDIQGRTVSPSGKVSELSKSDIRTITDVKIGRLSLKRKGFTLPALEPGCFVEYSYQEPVLLEAYLFYKEIPFQDRYPVLFQEVRTPESFPFYSSTRNQNGVLVISRKENGEYIYSARGAPALRDEPFGLPTSERAAMLFFNARTSAGTIEEYWNEIAEFFAAAFVENLASPGKVRDRLRTIEGSRDGSPAKRLRAIFRYIQTNIKNRSVLAAGETEPKKGWKENKNARHAISRGLGTGFDLVTVFASLLQADGWRFRVIFVPDREKRVFHRELPTILQFSGLIVEVKDPGLPSPVYVSFDHPLLPFGVVPWQYLGTTAFAVDIFKKTGEQISMSHPRPQQNAARREWTIAIVEDGDARIERVSRLSGQPGFELRAAVYEKGREAFEKERRAQYEQLDPPGEMESLAFVNEQMPEEEFVETVHVTRKGIVNSLPGGRIEFSPLKLIGLQNPFTQADRRQAIVFPYPYVESDTLTLTIPEGYTLESAPQPIDLRSDVGLYAVQIRKAEGNSITISRTFELDQFFGKRADYPQYKYLFESAARSDAGFSVILKKVTPAKTGT